MIQAIKNNILLIAAGIVLAFVSVTATMATPMLAHAADADIKNSVCSGADTLKVSGTPTSTCAQVDSSSATGLNNLIAKIINVFSVIVGVVAVIMIIYGGFRYITSGGDSNNIGSAKNTILYAIIGLIIVALAQVIVRFVLGSAATV